MRYTIILLFIILTDPIICYIALHVVLTCLPQLGLINIISIHNIIITCMCDMHHDINRDTQLQ